MLLASGKSRLLTLPLRSSVCFHRTPTKITQTIAAIALAWRCRTCSSHPKQQEIQRYQNSRRGVAASPYVAMHWLRTVQFPSFAENHSPSLLHSLLVTVALSRNGCPKKKNGLEKNAKIRFQTTFWGLPFWKKNWGVQIFQTSVVRPTQNESLYVQYLALTMLQNTMLGSTTTGLCENSYTVP